MDFGFLFCLLLATTTIAQVEGQANYDNDDDDGCEPTIADSCFHDVADDLRFIFDPVNNYLQATNESALSDLCNAWDDSLNCTSTIIDSDCRVEEGRLQFDAWNEGLKRVVEYLCSDDKNNLRAIAEAVHCWSIVQFLQCIETEASLVSIASLLQTPLDMQECNILQFAFTTCNQQASNRQCILGSIIVSTLQAGSDAFFNHVDCETPRHYSQQKAAGATSRTSVSPVSIGALLLFAVSLFT